jgi:hypothetical protein
VLGSTWNQVESQAKPEVDWDTPHSNTVVGQSVAQEQVEQGLNALSASFLLEIPQYIVQYTPARAESRRIPCAFHMKACSKTHVANSWVLPVIILTITIFGL